MTSYRGALVYKPDTNGSVYFAYGTSFNPSGEELSLVTSSRSFTESKRLPCNRKRIGAWNWATKWGSFANRLSADRRALPPG